MPLTGDQILWACLTPIVLGALMFIAVVFASHLNNATPNRSAAAALKGGAAAARLDLPRALRRAFQPAHHRP